MAPTRQVSGPPGKPPTSPKSRQAAVSVDPDQRAMALLNQVLVTRALEFAGKRRRKREDYVRLRDIPLHDTHRYMPPVADEDVPRLIQGWDSALAEETAVRMAARMGVNIEEIRSAVYAIVKRELTAETIEGEVG